MKHQLPRFVYVLAALGLLFVSLPLIGLLVSVPWSRIGSILLDTQSRHALGLSLLCSTLALAICALLGIPLGLALSRSESRIANTVRSLMLVPLVLPPVVGGIALLSAFGRTGIIGQPLGALTGFSLPFTTAGVVIAEAFVAFPFMVLVAESGFRSVNPEFEEAAASLGASPWRSLILVTLPLAAPSLFAASVLTWARALGEFGATITFAGNFSGRTQTVPIAVYDSLENSPASAYAISSLMIALCVVLMIVLRQRWVGPFVASVPTSRRTFRRARPDQ